MIPNCKQNLNKFDDKEDKQEVITTENGTAIKFANGIMIAYKNDLTTVNYNSENCVSTVTWTYPVKFINNPTCLANAIGGNSLSYSVLVGINGGISATIQLKAQAAYNANNYVDSSNRGINAFAIGRWK